MTADTISDLTIGIAAEADGWPPEAELEALTRRAFEAAVREGGLRFLPGSELSLMFSDDATVRDLNAHWRGQDKPTNVLSFPGGDPDGEEEDPVFGPVLGDIVFALETVRREADEAGRPFENHLLHLIVHGILHLFGYDHQVDEEAEEMENLERRILDRLNVPDPYADPD